MRYWTLFWLIVISICVGIHIAEGAKPIQRLLIVEESQQKAANDAAVKIFGPKARDTFSVKMEDTGKKVFFVCSWRLTDEDAIRLKTELDKISGKKPEVLKKVSANPKADEFTNARAKLKEKNLKPKTAAAH